MTATHAGDSPVLHTVMRDRVLFEARTALDILSAGNRPSVVSIAESHLPMYAAAVVAVMAEHHPDAEGNCAVCSRPGRWWWSRRVHSPCKAMLAVQFALSNPMDVLEAHLPRRIPATVTVG